MSTSAREGFGNTSLEAMACGCALVITENGGSSEFAQDDQNALVAPRNARPEHLADLVGQLIDDADLRRRLVTAGLSTARAFDWTESIDRFEAFLEDYRARPADFFDRDMFERDLAARLSAT